MHTSSEPILFSDSSLLGLTELVQLSCRMCARGASHSVQVCRCRLTLSTNMQVEAHILHKYANDFYGEGLKLAVLGFVRPEMAFTGLDDLINRIQMDIGIASSQLDSGALAPVPEDWWL